MANLELNIEFVIRAEPFTLEQTNELCIYIWLVYIQWNWVGLRHSLHMRRTMQLQWLHLMLSTVWMVMTINWTQLLTHLAVKWNCKHDSGTLYVIDIDIVSKTAPCPIHQHLFGPQLWFTVRTDRKSSYEPWTPFIRSARFVQFARLASN